MGMIDAKQAKEILGCDDATLQQHVNSGAIKAQRQGGKLLVDADDVDRLAKNEDEEGTIVLTGESDNLQIDLGKVVDDSSETIVQAKSSTKDSQQITFGEELEVVSLEDSKGTDTSHLQTRPTTASEGLSFTDSNTAVVTSVEDTMVGNTTESVDTAQQAGPGGMLPTGESGRRSVRSSRRNEVEVDVPWYWMAILALAFALGLLLIAPYYVLTTTATLGEKTADGHAKRGADDGIWAGMASGISGFHVEPDKAVWEKAGNSGEYKDISSKDGQASWRYKAYLGDLKGEGERVNSFVIATVSADGTKATSKVGNKEYPLTEKTVKSENGPEIKVLEAQVWSSK